MADDHPYMLANERDGIVYVSGAPGLDAENRPLQGDREALDAALNRVADRLAAIGLGLEHVVKTTYFVTDVTMRDAANAQYVERFPEPRPARTFVAVQAVPYGARVAIEAVAHR